MNPSGRLPLFPLGIVVYPDEPVPLHIFEQRYREMVQLCMAEDRPFGIVYATEDEIAEVGCTARVRRVLLVAAVILTFLVLAGATYQGVATAIERRQFRHPGRLVDAGL